MRELNQTIPQTSRNKSIIDLIQHQRSVTTQDKEPAERHFTKTISGEPGINPPARTYYPRSYSADGPGGNYSGL